MARIRRDLAEIDMTPMIDVVFQLIIFFIVTIQMEKEYNPDIELERSPHGPPIEGKQNVLTMEVEINRFGWISIHGAQLTHKMFRDIMRNRYNRYGQFPVLIRADKKTKHKDVKAVMDICTSVGIWRINFAAVKEERS